MRAIRSGKSGGRWTRRAVWGLGLAMLLPAAGGARPGYLRFPDIHGERVVFSVEGDLWLAGVDGGNVQRLTTHPGNEVLPRFSPDGEWIAFAGDYDGNRDVFVVPATGGEPKRLTWHPSPDEPLGWSRDGKEILLRSNRDHPHGGWEAYRVSVDGGDPQKIPIGYVVQFDVDPQTGRYAFTRNGGGGTWKRYRGGTADDIWVGDPDRADYAAVTAFDGMDAFPMWHGGRIYFLCDQGGTANLWSMNPDGSDRKRLTDLGSWDARWPAMGQDGRIVFMLGGDLHVFDPSGGTERAIPIDLPSERWLTRTRYPNPGQYVSGFALAPDGERVAVEARGEVFSIPVKEGVTLPITRGSGARETGVGFGPKGKRVTYITDESGEQAIVTADAWGRGEVKTVVPSGKTPWSFPPSWSPDGSWIAYSDLTHTLFVVKAEGGEPHAVDKSEQQEIREYAWSPDGRWLAYSKSGRLDRNSIFVYDTKERKTHQVTTWSTDDRSPAWDPDGRYLYFLSDRSINPVLDWIDFETIVVKPTRPYMLLLRKDVENPLAATAGAPPKDGAEKKDEKKKDEKKDGKGEEEADEEEAKPVEIDFDGLGERIVEIPVDPSRYFGLAATKEKIFFLEMPLRGLTEEDADEDAPQPGTLQTFELEEKEGKVFLEGVSGFDLKAGAGKIAVMKGREEIYVLDAGSPPGDDLSESQVSLDGMVIELDPREEWHQMFYEGWRNMRDFYWDAGMHGVDWTSVRDQYATLLPRISSRAELTDLLAEMIGELVNSHTYVWGGDPGRGTPMRPTGLLGAVLERENSAFRVARIYRGDPLDRIRSPLEAPEASVREGEYILAVNHQEFPANLPFESSLDNMAGKPVLLTVNARPERNGSRDVVVTTLTGPEDFNLRYADWVRHNREYVAEKTDGKIGYIHLPDMGGRGLREFDKWFYPQLDKEGMVVDARWNGGGFVSQLIVSRLLRKLVSWDRSRWGEVDTYPYRMLNGPFVVLTNQFAGSDGDIFPAVIQETKAAPIIGKRSWGGVVGIRADKALVDQGMLTQPEYAWFEPGKGWSIENHGVDPDIEIENLPQDLMRGIDAQLDGGIREVLRLRKERPPLVPEFGPAPDFSRKAYSREN